MFSFWYVAAGDLLVNRGCRLGGVPVTVCPVCLQVVETTSVGGRRLSQTVALRPEEHDGSPASTGDVGADGGGEDGRSGRVAFTASVEAPRRGPVMLALAAGQFETCTMPESVEQLWGPVFLPSLPAGVPNTCIVASHRSTRVIQVCVKPRSISVARSRSSDAGSR